MSQKLRLMCILAHPDDESLGTGGILARYAAEGVAISLVTATRGEHGWQGDNAAYPGPNALGQMREAELHAAAQVLGLHEVAFLDYRDGELDRANPAEVIGQLVTHIRRTRPDVVVTFDPSGYYGHPDHIAISQFATAAIVAAADPSYAGPTAFPSHRVAKLYYLAPSRGAVAAYQEAFGDLVMPVDRTERRAKSWDDWAITTRVDTSAYWQQVWRAVSCHRTQLPSYQALRDLPNEHHQQLWGTQTFYRAFSLVNGGRTIERDLFEGLRGPSDAGEKGEPSTEPATTYSNRAQSHAGRRGRERQIHHRTRGPYRHTRANPAGLTDRQMDVLRLVAAGRHNAAIAQNLCISPKTVDHHVGAIFDKLDVRSRAQATAAAARLGLLEMA